MKKTCKAILLIAAVVVLVVCSPTIEPLDDDGGVGSAACVELGRRDADGDGIPDLEEGDESIDTDGDGAPDLHDVDSDDDGRPDSIESGIEDCDGVPRDGDGDGVADFRDTDSDGNGIPDSDEPDDDDVDGDGIPDCADVDDDGDGIDDALEIGGDPLDLADSDSDGVPDYHDLDSDNDTITDQIEGSDDSDMDGYHAFRDTDCDNDGWLDEQEYGADPGEVPADSDSDGVPDYRDTDSDNDGLADCDERIEGTSRTEADTDGDGFNDLQEIREGTDPLNGMDYPMPDPCDPSECQPVELCGELGSGDGVDNNCNGEVDEICPCTPGESRPCFVGPPASRGQGSCTDGLLSCDEFGGWSECTGGVFPEPEICDGADNDCDGLFDEELIDCDSPLSCPSTQSAAPLTTIDLDGRRVYSGDYESWTWEVFCPITVDACPAPANPHERDTEVYIIQSGAYRMRATIVVDGETFTCEYTIEVQGDGLRVELTWDTQGSGRGDTDVDLHLHRPGTTTPWFDSNDDCYYGNCSASAHTWGDGPDWELPDTEDISLCNEAPHGHGAEWEALGFCANPRLDVDVVNCNPAETDSTSYNFCSPENINVDNPELYQAFRIMVNYFSEHSHMGVTLPTVNIYCGGALRATFGEGLVELVNGSSYGENNDNWLVADVEFIIDECGAVDCRITPILRDEAPWVQTGPDFGPPWL